MAAVLARIEEEEQRPLRHTHIFRDRSNPLDLYNDEEMFKKYRCRRDGILAIRKVEDVIRPKSNRNKAIPPALQIFIALRFFATGSVIDSSATIHGVSRATTCRVIHGVAGVQAAERLHKRQKKIQATTLLQGERFPDTPTVAGEPLPLPRQQPTQLQTQGHQEMEFLEPLNREGEMAPPR